jgi:hypothetical protein
METLISDPLSRHLAGLGEVPQLRLLPSDVGAKLWAGLPPLPPAAEQDRRPGLDGLVAALNAGDNVLLREVVSR